MRNSAAPLRKRAASGACPASAAGAARPPQNNPRDRLGSSPHARRTCPERIGDNAGPNIISPRTALVATWQALRSTLAMKWPLALALAFVAMPASAETRAGPATVIDGDTLEIDGRRIRLFGIDAPELSQSCERDGERWACGQASADELRVMIGAYQLSCTGDEEDTFGRLVAVCTVSGIDVGRQMVADGWATAFRRYSDKY